MFSCHYRCGGSSLTEEYLEEDVGGEARGLDGVVGDLVEHRVGHMVLGQIDRHVCAVRLPWPEARPLPLGAFLTHQLLRLLDPPSSC